RRDALERRGGGADRAGAGGGAAAGDRGAAQRGERREAKRKGAAMSEGPKTPLVTVDAIIEMRGGIVLIERKNPPHGWALPGGFVDVGEPVWKAAIREA